MQLNGRVQGIVGRHLRVQYARVGVSLSLSLSLGGVLFRRARKGVRFPDRPRFEPRAVIDGPGPGRGSRRGRSILSREPASSPPPPRALPCPTSPGRPR